MKLNLFSIPVYIGNIDIDKVKVTNQGFEKTWACRTNSSFNFQNTLEDDSAKYVLNVIYNFSFIIYKQIEEGKTVFVNPSDKSLLSYYAPVFWERTNFFELDYEPKCRQGQIIIFPSFLEHMVKETNDYCVTVSGNACLHIYGAQR